MRVEDSTIKTLSKGIVPLVFLTMLYVTLLLFSGVIAYKFIDFFGKPVSSAIFIFPLSYTILDIVCEIFGYRVSRIMIWLGTTCVYIFAILSFTFLTLHPALGFQHQEDYQWVLGSYWRLTLAGSISTVMGEFINTYTISKWKIFLHGRFFAIRSMGSTSVGCFIDTVFEYLIAFTGIVNLKTFLIMMGFALLLKIVYASILSIPASFIVTQMKKRYGDVYDYGVKFNPLRLRLFNPL